MGEAPLCLLGHRRWLAVMWLVLTMLACVLLMHGPDVAVLHAVRMLPASVVNGFGAITDAGLGHWYLIPTALAALGLVGWSYRLPDTPAGRERALWLRRLAWGFLFVFLAVALSGLITDVIKVVVGRARPKVLEQAGIYGFVPWSLRGDHQSFPSGHATTAVAVAMSLGYFWPRCRVPALAFGAVIALSRVVIGAHYLADVVGGAAVAAMTTWWLREWYAGHHVLFGHEADGRVRWLGLKGSSASES